MDTARRHSVCRENNEEKNRRDTVGAEAATGYYWGDPALEHEVSQLLAEAREEGNERAEQLAERYLNRIRRGT